MQEIGARQLDGLAPTWVPEGADVGGHTPRPQLRVVSSAEPTLLAGRYEVLKQIGSGGCGDVYLAMDRGVLGRRVAIKRLPTFSRHDARAIARFEQEARMAARVRHPGIVTVYDYELDEAGSPFLVMEYIRGRTLAELVERRPSVARVAAIGAQLCAALEALHVEGVVHRDVKPSNVMLAERHGALVVKLVDFGLAQPMGKSDCVAIESGLCGTPQYMAPEQILQGAVDARTDIFALGCLLYELLTGQPPGGRAARQLVLSRQLYATPPPLASRGVHVPPRLDRALRRALAKEPSARPASLAELRGALDWTWNHAEAVAERSGAAWA